MLIIPFCTRHDTAYLKGEKNKNKKMSHVMQSRAGPGQTPAEKKFLSSRSLIRSSLLNSSPHCQSPLAANIASR